MADPMIIQKQIKENAEDLHNFVRDLKLWEDEMKRKDRQLSTDQCNDEVLPPVRKAKLSNKTPPKKEVLTDSKKKRIPSSDYKSWDKFDVDKACEDLDSENINNSDEDEESTEQTEKYMKEKALYEKELGNQHVKSGKWDAAIEAYSKAISAYRKDPIFYANRALCYLKKKKWLEVESDCTEALKLDSTYVKAYLRRAVAREALDRLEDSKHDLRQVLRLEPGNTQAYRDLQRLQESEIKKNKGKACATRETVVQTVAASKESKINQHQPQTVTTTETKTDSSVTKVVTVESSEPNWKPCTNTVQAVTKPPHLRSKKSLKRIEIHDVGLNAPRHVCARNTSKQQDASLSTAQSSTGEVVLPTSHAPKPRSVMTLPGTRELPPTPRTSVQFHKSWSIIKDNSDLCYQFLKQIPGEELADIFKESLESRMFSKILETLASHCDRDSGETPVLPYLHGLTRVRRFSTLVLFLSSSDKSNLTKLFEYCFSQGDCSSSDIEHLQRLYEM